MDVIQGLVDRWKSLSADFERNMNEFLMDFETFFEGTNKRQEALPTLKGNEEVCEDAGKTYQVGESWSEEGECNLKVCHPRKVISVRKCPEWVAPKECRTKNLFKSNKFPDCCPSVICPIPTST